MTNQGSPSPGEGLFDEEVEAYDAARPTYPDELFSEIDALVKADHKGRREAVEIGPGTGKATGSLLAYGFRVTAVEHGTAMSAFLQSKFAGQERLQVMCARFEDVNLPPRSFDLVFSATAFHWIDREVRLPKSHALLRPGGVIAIVDTNQVASELDRGFFDRCLPIYQRYRPDEKHHTLAGSDDVVPDVYDEIAASPLFESLQLFRYRWDQTYPTQKYADLVRSYQRTQRQPREEREAMISELCELIDADFDGYVLRPLVITLALARAL